LKRFLIVSLVWLFALPVLAGCGRSGDLMVENAWARPGISGGNGGAFFTINNPTSSGDKIIQVKSDVADAVELHQTTMEDDVMKMTPQEFVDVPANSTVEFAPGGLHVMLIGLTDDLAVGDKFQVLLEFEDHAPIQFDVTVLEP
jgi:hypothetical protein